MLGNFPCLDICSRKYDHYVWQHEQEEKLVARVLSRHFSQAHLTITNVLTVLGHLAAEEFGILKSLDISRTGLGFITTEVFKELCDFLIPFPRVKNYPGIHSKCLKCL